MDDEDYSTQRVYIGDVSQLSECESADEEPDTPIRAAGSSTVIVISSDSEAEDPADSTQPSTRTRGNPSDALQSVPVPSCNSFSLMMAASAKLSKDTPARKPSRPSVRTAGKGKGIFTKREGPCPFYKLVPGTATPFVVDCFQWTVPGCRHYFLTHFHSDHYGGLNRHFADGTIYCSETTAALVLHEIKVSPSRIKALPMYRPNMIDGVKVTLLDANHCPGAAMLLFEIPAAGGGVRRHLHVGDFRWTPRMASFPALLERAPIPGTSPLTSTPKRFDTLFLDTTFCHPSYDFPPQAAVREFTVNLTAKVRCVFTRCFFIQRRRC